MSASFRQSYSHIHLSFLQIVAHLVLSILAACLAIYQIAVSAASIAGVVGLRYSCEYYSKRDAANSYTPYYCRIRLNLIFAANLGLVIIGVIGGIVDIVASAVSCHGVCGCCSGTSATQHTQQVNSTCRNTKTNNHTVGYVINNKQ